MGHEEYRIIILTQEDNHQARCPGDGVYFTVNRALLTVLDQDIIIFSEIIFVNPAFISGLSFIIAYQLVSRWQTSKECQVGRRGIYYRNA
jgi:hypothetical protein